MYVELVILIYAISMGVQAVIRRVFTSAGGPVVVHECRRCGTSVNADADACPTCGVSEISRYEIS